MMDHYNSFGFTLVFVTPKGEGCSLVKWSMEFEKANENVPTPNAYVNLMDKITRELPAKLF
ncbi:hypothetical protein MKW92_032984 [Papaver armeniacum]|nr:hypothetical protein MKW92_032984 [Papaver armeniacum]